MKWKDRFLVAFFVLVLILGIAASYQAWLDNYGSKRYRITNSGTTHYCDMVEIGDGKVRGDNCGPEDGVYSIEFGVIGTLVEDTGSEQ